MNEPANAKQDKCLIENCTNAGAFSRPVPTMPPKRPPRDRREFGHRVAACRTATAAAFGPRPPQKKIALARSIRTRLWKAGVSRTASHGEPGNPRYDMPTEDTAERRRMTSVEFRKQLSVFVPLSDWRVIRGGTRLNIPMTELCRRWMRLEIDRLKSEEKQ